MQKQMLTWTKVVNINAQVQEYKIRMQRPMVYNKLNDMIDAKNILKYRLLAIISRG